MNRFLIVTNEEKDEGLVTSHEIADYLSERGASVSVIGDTDRAQDGMLTDTSAVKDVQAVIVLGGDGTMLRAVHGLGAYGIPMVGINMGTLGFLTEIEKANYREACDRLLADDYKIEERMMIEGSAKGSVHHALNDVVVTRAGFSRIIAVHIYVNDQLLETYEADGVIVSTPTGSTGYNLSAGGPIVTPKGKAIVVTPISPHKLSAKSVVFDASDTIRLEIVRRSRTQDTEAIVSFDGAHGTDLSCGDTIFVRRSDRIVRLIKMSDINFYRVLRDKIGN